MSHSGAKEPALRSCGEPEDACVKRGKENVKGQGSACRDSDRGGDQLQPENSRAVNRVEETDGRKGDVSDTAGAAGRGLRYSTRSSARTKHAVQGIAGDGGSANFLNGRQDGRRSRTRAYAADEYKSRIRRPRRSQSRSRTRSRARSHAITHCYSRASGDAQPGRSVKTRSCYSPLTGGLSSSLPSSSFSSYSSSRKQEGKEENEEEEEEEEEENHLKKKEAGEKLASAKEKQPGSKMDGSNLTLSDSEGGTESTESVGATDSSEISESSEFFNSSLVHDSSGCSNSPTSPTSSEGRASSDCSDSSRRATARSGAGRNASDAALPQQYNLRSRKRERNFCVEMMQRNSKNERNEPDALAANERGKRDSTHETSAAGEFISSRLCMTLRPRKLREKGSTKRSALYASERKPTSETRAERADESDCSRKERKSKRLFEKEKISRQKSHENREASQRPHAHSASKKTKVCDFCAMDVPERAIRCAHCHSALEICEQMQGEGYVVQRRRTADGESGRAVESVTIQILDDGLRRRLQNALPHEATLLQQTPTIALSTLFGAREALRDDPQCRPNTFLGDLIAWIDGESESLRGAFEEMRQRGVTTFDALVHAFEPGDRCWTLVDGQRHALGFVVQAAEVEVGTFRTFFVVTGTTVHADGERFVTLAQRFSIPQFDGLRKLDQLPIRHLSKTMEKRLEDRGRVYRRVALGHHYLAYTGSMLRRARKPDCPTLREDAAGRIMVDGATMRRVQPGYPFVVERESTTGIKFSANRSLLVNNRRSLATGGDEQSKKIDVGTCGAGGGGGGRGRGTALTTGVVSDHLEREAAELDDEAECSELRLCDALLFCTPPHVYGFSFRLKKWGEFCIDGLGEIEFNSDAFARVVLPDSYRSLVRAVVTDARSATSPAATSDALSIRRNEEYKSSNGNAYFLATDEHERKPRKDGACRGLALECKFVHESAGNAMESEKQKIDAAKEGEADLGDGDGCSAKRRKGCKISRLEEANERAVCSFQGNLREKIQGSAQCDLVRDKGNGCVILLHGPPGVGKTLTVEAVADDLRAPLYSVSIGELGTTPEQLEKRLRAVLDLSAHWGSVTLIDEVDAFVSARSDCASDITRNGMVCVFLRLLEYHSGILFLTTNRLRSFDDAFYSRVQLALVYEPLTLEARTQVWRTLLDLSGLAWTPRSVHLDRLASVDLNGRQVRNVIRLASMLARSRSETFLKAAHFALPLEHQGRLSLLLKSPPAPSN